MEIPHISCPFDFSLYIERELRESKAVAGPMSMEALEKFAMFCFMTGFKAGQLPENHPSDMRRIK